MGLADLGYQPFEGARLPVPANYAVMYRHALREASRSWLVRLALVLGWLPALGKTLILGVGYMATRGQASVAPSGAAAADGAGALLASLLSTQTWVFVFAITLGAGATAVSDDLAARAFSFFFAKPVARRHYLVGRVGAVASFSLAMTLGPALLVLAALLATAPTGAHLARAALVLPLVADAAVIALTLSICAVGVSALSANRALASSTWILLFFVPSVLAAIASGLADWPYLYLASLPSLTERVGEALFQTPPSVELPWALAALVLAAATALLAGLAAQRVARVEVVQ